MQNSLVTAFLHNVKKLKQSTCLSSLWPNTISEPPLLSAPWAQSIDKKLRNITKSALKLPRRTTNSFLQVGVCCNRYGGLGFKSMEDNLDVARITQFFKRLTSPNDIVKQCAWTQLSQVVGKRLKKQDISPQDMESFLNSPPPPNEGSRGDIQSLWSIVRKSLHRLGILVSVTDSNSIELDLSGTTIMYRHQKKASI